MSRWLDVLDHLDEASGVEVLQACVAVRRRSVQQRHTLGDLARKALRIEAPLCNLETAQRYIHAHDTVETLVAREAAQELSFPASEIDDAPDVLHRENLVNARQPYLVQLHRRLQGFLL